LCISICVSICQRIFTTVGISIYLQLEFKGIFPVSADVALAEYQGFLNLVVDEGFIILVFAFFDESRSI